MPFFLPVSVKVLDQDPLIDAFFSTELPVGTFNKWKEYHELRNKEVGKRTEVNLENEPKAVFFKKAMLDKIIGDPDVDNIVIRFGCINSELNGFSELTASVQGRDSKNNIVTTTYIGSFAENIPEPKLDDWIGTNEKSFQKRNKIINGKGYSSKFKNEIGGVQHENTKFKTWLTEIGTTENIAIFFIYDTDKTTGAFVDSKFIPDATSSTSSFTLYDQGNRCCP